MFLSDGISAYGDILNSVHVEHLAISVRSFDKGRDVRLKIHFTVVVGVCVASCLFEFTFAKRYIGHVPILADYKRRIFLCELAVFDSYIRYFSRGVCGADNKAFALAPPAA